MFILINVSSEKHKFILSPFEYGVDSILFSELISESELKITDGGIWINIDPYQVMWIRDIS